MNTFLRIVLTPLSWLYGLGVTIRNILYDEHLLHSSTVSVPTICVGNLAVGGTGKTPHVEYLIRLLTQNHYRVAVLSRGYKRRTKGYILADEQATAERIGDEPMQLYRKFPNVAVVVCEHRVRAIRRMQRELGPIDCIILDDAFQHRRLRCGYNIVLTAYDNLYVNDRFLPVGRLRDNVHQILRANTIVVTKCPESLQPIDRRVVLDCLQPVQYQQLYFSCVKYAEIKLPGAALVVAGIAHPEPLLQHVQKMQPASELYSFADHHAFSESDVERLRQRAARMTCVVTTEKDYERLRMTPLPEEWGDKLVVVAIEVQITPEPEQFDRAILRYVSENRRTSSSSNRTQIPQND